MTAYEVGTKMALFGSKVQINLAGYYYDWKNFQATTQVNVKGLPLVILASAGKAHIKGLDGAITDGTIIDATGAPPKPHHTILITQGKIADVIVVPGDPIKDMRAMRNVAVVIKEGVRYK